jgi:FlaA1/EpsC-like NDP-sugar epimerase
MTMLKMSLQRLNRLLKRIKNEKGKRSALDLFTWHGWIAMKRFGDGFITALLLLKALINRSRSSVVLCLRQYDITIVLSGLTVIAGFEVVIAIQLFSGVRILPLGIILGGALLSFLALGYIKTLPRARYGGASQEINVADLLEREVVPLQASEAHSILKGQVVLVTGAAGSIGSELCRQLLNYEPKLVIALDNNETGLFDLNENLRAHLHSAHLYIYISDITDRQRMERLFREMQPRIIFHAAAYKHVPLLEHFPDQAIRTNVLATYHLCRLAQKYEVLHFVFISTDKVVEPTGIMGVSKRIGEMIVQSLATSAEHDTCFCAVRFGNVIGSRGSVVPVFAQQIENGGPVTVTDPRATRYFMTIPEACGLVILTATITQQGGLYLLDMGNPARIIDLALKMIRLRGLRVGKDISIVYTGLRPGEHLHETLVAANEELTSTIYSKIYSVTCSDKLPPLATIVQWMDIIEDSLQYESDTQLRERLFEIVRGQLLDTSLQRK